MGSYDRMAVLQRPAAEDAAGYVLLERFFQKDIPVSVIWRHPQCSPEQLAQWEADGVFSLCLGQERKELELAGNMVIEYVANRFPTVELTAGEQALVKVMTRHNRSSYLNKVYGSVHRLTRWWYDLFTDQIQILEQLKKVIHCWIRVKDGEGEQTWQDDAEFCSRFSKSPDLPIDLSRSNSALTIGRHIRDLCVLGHSPDQALEEAIWWLGAYAAVEERFQGSEEQFRKMDVRVDWAGDRSVLAMYTSDRFLTRAIMRSGFCDVFVAIRPDTGHVSILTNGWNVHDLAKALQSQEGYLWWEDKRNGWIVNGGFRNDEAPATALSYDEKIFKAISKNPPYPPANK